MKRYTKPMVNLLALIGLAAALSACGAYVYHKGHEAGRYKQADIDFRTIHHLCTSGKPFTITDGRYVCREFKQF